MSQTPTNEQKPDSRREINTAISSLDRLEAPTPKWDSMKNDLKDIYNRAVEQNRWGEVAEKVGQALTQLGAGYYGLKSGVDMSGLKFAQTDWEKRYDRLLDELRTGIGDVEESRKAEERGTERVQRQQELLEDRKFRESQTDKEIAARRQELQQRAADERGARAAERMLEDVKSKEKQKAEIELLEKKAQLESQYSKDKPDYTSEQIRAQDRKIEALKLAMRNFNDDESKDNRIRLQNAAIDAGMNVDIVDRIIEEADDEATFGSDEEYLIANLTPEIDKLRYTNRPQSKGIVPRSEVQKFANDNKVSVDQATKYILSQGYTIE
jgi:hypothetical protein